MILQKKKKKNRGNVSSEIIKLAIACMKRTPDSIRKTAIAKEKVGHDITVGYQLYEWYEESLQKIRKPS